MTDPIALADLSIIGTLGMPRERYGVRTSMHEVMLADGSLHRMHAVLDLGVPAQYLRALQLSDGATYAVFDLRHLSRALGADLCTCAARDMPGIVTYTLRPLFPNAKALRVAVVGYSHALGIPTPRSQAALGAAA